jgi:hypothetical protein
MTDRISLPSFLRKPQKPGLAVSERRQSQIDNITAIRGKAESGLSAQIATFSDDEFTDLVVTEAGRRGMTDLWRKLP